MCCEKHPILQNQSRTQLCTQVLLCKYFGLNLSAHPPHNINDHFISSVGKEIYIFSLVREEICIFSLYILVSYDFDLF